MNRSDFQLLAEERLLDAQTLLGAQRWAGAYYLRWGDAMDQAPLVDEWRVVGKAFLEDFSLTFPLKVAVWLKEADGGPWYLHIASDKITTANRREAYAEIILAARRTGFDPLRVVLTRADDPLVQAVMHFQPRQPRTMGTYYDHALPGVSGAEGAYFYPASDVVGV